MMFQGRGKLCQMTDGPSLTGEAGAIDPSLEGMTLNCQAAGVMDLHWSLRALGSFVPP